MLHSFFKHGHVSLTSLALFLTHMRFILTLLPDVLTLWYCLKQKSIKNQVLPDDLLPHK